MSKKSKDEILQDNLTHEYKNAWTELDDSQTKDVFTFADEYKKFLDRGKIERECTLDILKYAKEHGFADINSLIGKGDRIAPGTKVYALNRDKAIVLFIIGKKGIDKGMNVVVSHLDAPRIDLKVNPLYEDTEMAFFKTHYYGGIKKYQRATIPLAIHGVIFDKDGNKKNIVVGEDSEDPVFYITDILPHLAKDQNEKKIAEAIKGEDLNILCGSIPYGNDKIKEKVKFHILKILNEKYGIREVDFTSAELVIVPAGKARDVGFDRSLISAYGHDDRVCSFAGLKGVLEIENPERTAVLYCADKEEIGSVGNTGAHSDFFANTVAELIALQSDYSDLLLRRTFSNTKVLSADVSAPYDPKFADTTEKGNTAHIGKGVQIMKYTGARGKSGCNDANAEFVTEINKLFTDNNIIWQTGELGKVDQGGGGTIAYILANANADVVDCGVPVLSMHAPYEVISKVDLFMAYRAYKAFLGTSF
jgi:aspartyl aminopeptidase